MGFDPGTAVAAIAFVALISGLVLLLVGRRFREAPTAGLLGVSNLFIAAGLPLLIHGTNYQLGFLFLLGSTALMWASMAEFQGRRPSLVLVGAGLAIWAVVTIVGDVLTFGERTAVSLAVVGVFQAGGAYELWRGRREALPATTAMLALIVADIVGVLLGIVVALPQDIATAEPATGGALWLVYLVAMVFVIGTAVLLVAMIKERSIREQQRLAGTDALTGIRNRGALMEAGAAALARARTDGALLAVAVFDLDRFKSINDNFGHHTGDAVLQRFAECARRSVRSTDFIGRIGGEEFVAVLPGAGREVAIAIAERVRTSFAESAAWIDGKPVKGTVSAGIAFVTPGANIAELDIILSRADAALYVAKRAGRDRIATEPDDGSDNGTVIRIA